MPPESDSLKSQPLVSSKPKKRRLTILLFVVLVGVGIFAINRVFDGELFKAASDKVSTTVGGEMSAEQKASIEGFRKRLSVLREQREALAQREAKLNQP